MRIHLNLRQKKREIKKEKKKGPGCLFYIWILSIILGIIISQVRNESFFSPDYIVIFVITPPLFYYVFIKNGWFLW
jgi:hypothetical protein